MHTYSNLHKELSDRFKNKKLYSNKLAACYSRLGLDKRSSRVNSCGEFLQFGLYDDDSVKLHNANFCRDPLCPMCAWRKSLKLFEQVYSVVEALKDTHKFVFLTLTCRNCSADELSYTLDLLSKSFNKLMRRKRLNFVRGAFKALEVTYNNKTKEFHPHLHIIFAVDNDYFTSTDYLKTAELVSIWKKCLKCSYNPICDIRTIKENKKGSDAISSAVAEVAKYPVKSSDFLSYDNDTNDFLVDTLLNALVNRHMFEFYGIFSETRKKLKFDDIENGDLINVSADADLNKALLIAVLTFSWSKDLQCYYNSDVQIISADTAERGTELVRSGGPVRLRSVV